MKPGRFNAYLFITILLVGAGYYGLHYQKTLRHPYRVETGSLIPFDVDALRDLRIKSSRYEVEIQQAHGQWRLTSPVNDLASPQAVQALVEPLRDISLSPVAGISLSEGSTLYGTEPPQWTLEFSDGFEPRTLFIGQELPVGDGTYIRLPNEKKLYVTSRSVLPLLPDSFEVFRDLSLLDGTLEDVTRIEHIFGEHTLEARKEDARSWTLVEPFTGRGNRAEIEALIQHLLTLEMSGVAADRVSDPGVYGIDQNSRMLRVEWADKPAQTVRVGSRKAGADTLYVSISGRDSIYTLPGDVLHVLNLDPDTLRDKRPLPTSIEALQSISIQHPDFSTQLSRTNTNWIVKGTREQPALDQKVNALIALWTAPVIESFAPQISTTNTLAPEKILRIEFESKTETDSLGKWIFETPIKQLSAPTVETRSVSDQEIIEIPSALVNPAMLMPIRFYKPNLWSFPIEKTQSLEYGLHHADSLTRLATASTPHTLSLLQSIKPLRIAAEEPDMMPAAYFPDTTEKLVFKLPAEDGISRTLLIGNHTDGGNRFVKLLGNPLVYLVDPSPLQKVIADIEHSGVKDHE